MDSVNRNAENRDEVLVKYLLGEATETEQAEVQHWIDESEENKRYYSHFKLIWDESKKLAGESTVNENDAWDRFMLKVQAAEKQEQETEVPKARTIPFYRTNWMKAAAILIMMIGCGSLYYYTAGPGSIITVQAGDVAMATNLPDGSVVTLNRNSAITYPAKFRGDTRHVTLKGEGFFNVTPDKSKPFIIDADNSTIKVMGTSFNVKSSDECTEVIVETGIVEVAKKQYVVRVQPHQKATVLKSEDMPVMESNKDMLYNYYRTKEFVCDETPLYKLVDVLNEAFDAHIVIANSKLRNTAINDKYKDQNLDAILENIKGYTGATIERNGDQITLR